LALSRKQKEEMVKAYGEKLSRAQVAIWSSFTGLTVGETTLLRRQLDEAGAEAIVVKNTLMNIALQQAGLPTNDEFAEGANIVTFAYDDIAGAAKALTDYVSNRRDLVTIKGGIVDGKVATGAEIRSLTSLPSREVLLAQLLSGLQGPIGGLVQVLSQGSPINGLANVLNGTVKSIMYVLQARVEQLEGASS
jgi:large subunit ribosomal protein L10